MKNTNIFKDVISGKIIIIGTNLKRIRNDKKITQQELAYLSENMERATISKIECFNCDNVSLKTLMKICIVLEIDIEDLLHK